MMLATALGAVYFLEQPSTSLLPRHDRFLAMIRDLNQRGMRAP